MPSKTEIWTGLDPDELVQAFLMALLPTLPQHWCIFQLDDINEKKAKITLAQFVEHYHSITDAIDTGYGPKATLSPSAWLRSIADLTTRILNGIMLMRSNLPNSVTPHDVGLLFSLDDWDTIVQIQSNLDHLSKVFTLSPESPSLICTHWIHKTDQNQAQDHCSEADYMAILMASDCSWTAILDQILAHTSTTIEKEVNTWAEDKGTHQWNILRPQIREAMESFYKARMKQIHIT
jgi:hypothetical protein